MIPRERMEPPPLFAPAVRAVDPNLAQTKRPDAEDQNARVLAMLRKGPVTSVALVQAGILRGAARIHDLRQAGYRILTERAKGVAQ